MFIVGVDAGSWTPYMANYERLVVQAQGIKLHRLKEYGPYCLYDTQEEAEFVAELVRGEYPDARINAVCLG